MTAKLAIEAKDQVKAYHVTLELATHATDDFTVNKLIDRIKEEYDLDITNIQIINKESESFDKSRELRIYPEHGYDAHVRVSIENLWRLLSEDQMKKLKNKDKELYKTQLINAVEEYKKNVLPSVLGEYFRKRTKNDKIRVISRVYDIDPDSKYPSRYESQFYLYYTIVIDRQTFDDMTGEETDRLGELLGQINDEVRADKDWIKWVESTNAYQARQTPPRKTLKVPPLSPIVISLSKYLQDRFEKQYKAKINPEVKLKEYWNS